MVNYKPLVAAAIITGLLPFLSLAQTITDGSFESMGATLGNGTKLSPYPAFVSGWAAVNTDGECYNDGNAFDGSWYIDLLQNAAANPNTFWDEATFAVSGYDRVLTTITNLNPNTSYAITFYHSTQLNRFGYFAGQTLVQLQSVQTNDAASFLFTTPSTNTWTPETINFTTDAATTSAYLLFSPLGGNAASVSIDNVTLSVPDTCPQISLTFTVAVTNAGLSNGAMRVTASGGEIPYLYSLDSLTFQTNNIFTSLDIGTYTIYVTDNNSCPAQGTFAIDETNCNCVNH